MVPDSCHLSLRSTVQKHTSIGILVHLLLLTVHPESVKPSSTPRMVLNGLRSPIASALPDLRVPVRSVRPAARLRPLNNVILVFMVADCCPHSQCLCLSTDSHRSFALDKRQFGNLEVMAFLQPAGRYRLAHCLVQRSKIL